MVIDMNDSRLTTLPQLQAVLDGTTDLALTPMAPEQRRAFIARVLRRFDYPRLRKPDKGLVLRYLRLMTGYSRQQLTRLVRRWQGTGTLKAARRAPVAGFTRTYTEADVALLAEVDSLHNTLAGPATCVLLKRAFKVYGDGRFERLARLSSSHLYNLRRAAGYQRRRRLFTHTQPAKAPVSIGVRKAPQPQGRPGFIRIDSVHQGDQDGVKGLYHINAVDCVTQWQVVASCQRISEAFLLPVIEQMLAQFPFPILGLHADNGGEYINHAVAGLLDKLRIELTKSRPRKTNDNALVESKNGAVVRKCFGYAHIPQHRASAFNDFCQRSLNPYLNFHRPCAFVTETINAKGKIIKRYPHDQIMTPCDKLLSLDQPGQWLKPGMTLPALRQQARKQSDSQAAKQLNDERDTLFRPNYNRSRRRA